jgi:hypothetical protein
MVQQQQPRTIVLMMIFALTVLLHPLWSRAEVASTITTVPFVPSNNNNSNTLRTLVHRIAFGSCFNPNRGDSIFRLLARFHPDQFLSLGDLVYADFHPSLGYKRKANPEIIFNEYVKVTQESRAWRELFRNHSTGDGLTSSTTKVVRVVNNDIDAASVVSPAVSVATAGQQWPGEKELGKKLSSLRHTDYSPAHLLLTYDDHDFGANNADGTFRYRNDSLALFYAFFPHMQRQLSVPLSHTNVVVDKEGVFSSHTFTVILNKDTPENLRDKTGENNMVFRYKVVLLDSRSNKSPKHQHSPPPTFLGAQQWSWLERELHPTANEDVDLVLLGSSIQVLVDDKLVEETWSEFPVERARLLSLLSRLSLFTNVVVLSGDVHSGEIAQATCSVHQTGDRMNIKLPLTVHCLCWRCYLLNRRK